MHFFREFVEAGGLLSYAPSDKDLFRRAAQYVELSPNLGDGKGQAAA